MEIFITDDFIKDIRLDLNTSITIGNFDGYHLAHQKLVSSVSKFCEKNLEKNQVTIKKLVLTFDPHPAIFYKKRANQSNLFTLSQKIQVFKEAEVDTLVIQKFSQAFSDISHDFFYRSGLIKGLKVISINIGENFCFGKNRAGNVEWLSNQTMKDSLDLKVLPSLFFEREMVNSSRIRKLLKDDGNINLVNKLLGHFFVLSGIVVKGEQIGRQLGFPTANIACIEQLIPKKGVYCAYAYFSEQEEAFKETILSLPKKTFLAVVNIGNKPTVSAKSSQTSIEVHIIDEIFMSDYLYGKKLSIYFTERIRDEIKFDDILDLQQQIIQDIAYARKKLKQ